MKNDLGSSAAPEVSLQVSTLVHDQASSATTWYNRTRGHVKILAMAIMVLTVSGCSWVIMGITPYTRDLSNQDALCGGYTLGAIYQLQRDVFVVRNAQNPRIPLLLPPRAEPRLGMLLYTMPESASEWESAPERWGNVRGFVKVGTRLRVTRITEQGSHYGHPAIPQVHVYVTVLDGSYQGKTFDIYLLSIPTGEDIGGIKPLQPDERLLIMSQ